MKKATSIILFVVLTVTAFGQQAQKTLLKTFNLEGNRIVLLDLDGEVILEEWDNTTARVQMEIIYNNSNVNMMKLLISKGRYNLKTVETNEGFSITSEGRKNDVIISKAGDILNETVNYTVFVPRGTEIRMLNEAQSSISTNEKTVNQ